MNDERLRFITFLADMVQKYALSAPVDMAVTEINADMPLKNANVAEEAYVDTLSASVDMMDTVCQK